MAVSKKSTPDEEKGPRGGQSSGDNVAAQRKGSSASNKNYYSAQSNIEKSGNPEEKQKGRPSDFFRIFKHADGLDRLLYVVAFTGAVVVGAALPLMTIVFGQSTSSFNAYVTSKDSAAQFEDNVKRLILYFVYLFVGRFVIGYIGTLCICIAAARTTNALRKAFLESLLRQDIAHFDLHDGGSTATQVTTNGHLINQGIAEKLYTFVMGLSLFFSSYIVALSIQWKLALITMSIVPAMVLTVGACVSLDAPIEARIVQTYSRAANLAQDALSSIKTIHAFGAEPRLVKWYNEYLETAHRDGDKKSFILGVLFASQPFLVMAGTALAFWEGYRLFQRGQVSNVGTVFTAVLSVTLGATSVLLFLPQLGPITNAASAASELFTIMDKPSLLDPLSSSGKQLDHFAGDIELRDLHFAYPSRPTVPVLQGLNLTLPRGKTTALVGPSGCGKSTVVGLLERWYLPTSGHIFLDGCDISELNTKWLRSNVRLIQQEPTLFQGTVFENIAKGFVREQLDMPIDKQRQLVREACITANAHDFIEKLPNSYDTELGERANNLSGGQRQRLSIARSIISNPKVLLCDEATSALDPQAEKVVQDALDCVSKDKTTLLIAHKIKTIMAADNIIVIANGKIHEQGTHRQLVERDDLYAAMVRAQDLDAVSQNDDTAHQKHKDDATNTFALDAVQPELISHVAQPKEQSLTTQNLGYSLFKCVFLMLQEHKDLYHLYGILVVAQLIVGGTYPTQSILLSRLIRAFTLQGPEGAKDANFYSLMFFILALANLLGSFVIGTIANKIGQTLTHRYRREMLERVLAFDQDFFDYRENTSGALTAKLSSVPSAIQDLMCANFGLLIKVMVNVVASAVLAIAFGWKLGLIMVFAGLFVIVGSGYMRIHFDRKIEISTETQFASSASLAAEMVSAIKTVSVLTLEESVLLEYSQTLDNIVAGVKRNSIFTLVPFAFSQSVDFLVMALGFWYGSRLVVTGEYSVTQFFVIFISVVFGGQAASQFFTWTSSFTKMTNAANYLFWLRTVKSEIRTTDENAERGPSGDGTSIGFENVEFRYRQQPSRTVLHNLSMDIETGSYMAVVGPSGCGKSTIISLLERFYDPTSGRISFNGDDISQMSPTLYRKSMSLVQQEPLLYMGSVWDNICIGSDREPSEKEVQEACRQADAMDFIASLPEGLQTPCGSRGLQFSGGQRQRIAVARALIRQPRLLLLDEATSALDTQSERAVQAALEEAAVTRTTIAVAHRLSTIRHADVIFVMEDGKVAEMGTHEELQGLRGKYHAMCLAQALDQTF
ncbi:Leptomycin B resistance protein pmd1 [Beauveria bassiana]|nr:Leptomycin B resistance protein pmd1 [Beauveria bassiana]